MTPTSPVIVIIQARIGSTRLTGKVLRPLAGRPMVGHVISRAARIPGIDGVVVAIPELPEDDPLAAYLSTVPETEVVRGPSEDVLARYLLAASIHRAQTIIRITADCPLLCPEISGRVLREFGRSAATDYASNTLERTYPRGLDTEVVSRRALEVAGREAARIADREHVTPFIWRQPERFVLQGVRDRQNNSDLRWTVDTEEDLRLVARLCDAFAEARAEPDYEDLLTYARLHPELASINREVRQKEVEA